MESPPSCPLPTPLTPDEQLSILHRKRLSHTYLVNAEGARELRIDYGVKEVTFDDERFFPFGESLVREPTFTGAQATTWGPGYAWDELQPLLEALIDEGIVHRGAHVDDPRQGGLVPSRVPPSTCPVPRSWTRAECEAITRDLAGREVEIGHLEAFVPVFRIAHPALDADDRQVGEANVFPTRLRLDRPTEWRACQYAGSRYRDDAPMNITALRAMIKHWKPIMALTLAVRAELARRMPVTRTAWTIGELHTLSCVVLGLPAFELQRCAAAPPPVHPVLSSMFRITDGIRMTTSTMLFSIEHTRRADEPLSAAALYAAVEDNGVFIGDTGVCAGPKPMVDEFLATAVDGVRPEGLAGLELPPEVEAVLAQLPSAIDYGLLGLQAWAVSQAVWLAMSRAYQAIAPLFERLGGEHLAGIRTRLGGGLRVFDGLQLNLPYDQRVHLDAYRDAYERSWRLLAAPAGPPTLAEALAGAGDEGPAPEVTDALRRLLAARLDDGRDGIRDVLDQLAAAVVGYLREEAAVLAATARIQAAINRLLDRPAPTRPLGVRDLRVGFLLAPGVTAFPYLLDVLERELGIAIDTSSAGIAIADRRAPPT